jgi:site-specific DNA recombinase
MNTKSLTDKEFALLEKDILAGKFKDSYLIYNRKSTDEPNNQKNSLSYQKHENVRLAANKLFPIADLTIPGFCTGGIISEKHSGFKEDAQFTIVAGGLIQYRVERPKFYQLIGYLSQGHFKGVICLLWDRISRNKADDVLINKLMKQGIDFVFAYAQYDDNSAGLLHMDIDGMFAQHHSRVTSEKVKLTMRESRENRKVTNRAPLGYLNEGNMDWKPLDLFRAPIIKQLFEMYATSEWSLSDLARWANEQGLTTMPMRRKRTEEEMLSDEDDESISLIPKVSRPMTLNMIHKIFMNPFYKGYTRGNDKTWVVSASHEPLVSEELFDKVKAMRSKRNVSAHYAEVLPLSYRKLVRCECGRVYTPYTRKGIDYLYSRCPVSCINQEKSINAEELEDAIGAAFQRLSFTDEELMEIDDRTKTNIGTLEGKRHKELEQLERRKKKIREDLAYLRTNKIPLLRTGVYTPEDFLAEENKLNAELTDLQVKEQVSDVSMAETIKEIIHLSELIKNLCFYYDSAEPHEKDEIIRKIFSELTLCENTLQFKCKTAFKALERRFAPECDPTGNRTPLPSLRRMCPNR